MTKSFEERTREQIGKRVEASGGRRGTIIAGDFSTGRWTVRHDDGTEAEYLGPQMVEIDD